uniref:Guanine nucleotide-binding protein subunit gamma n=2 Tax=Delphinidae TaxID=9726 RepID=A0A6J3QFK8_TURTR|nr:guanine nucleotide-binding protein G(I)/G(S)/G(O) subunit gamma-10-like [Tursiops truncatus]XP_059856514.1 guanine nucleotide-binding protein G(I)/G(S)/G(O) subunit gamma-10-like [Delphinus delphis]CAG9553707.1 heterotrimeric guanine nucleotide-binding protein 3M2 [Tursiops truncatus]
MSEPLNSGTDSHSYSTLKALKKKNLGASVSTLQRLVEQLKLEAGVERIKVSQAAAELQQYCMQNGCNEALLVGVPARSNLFREPRSCALL